MWVFLKKILIFALFPFIIGGILFSGPLIVAYKTKELLHVDTMIYLQQKNDVLLGPAIQGLGYSLKYRVTTLIHPDVLVLGTSRVMQFREEFFSDEISFYNAGGGIDNLPQCIDFINALDMNPQFILIGLDQYFFNEQWAIPTPDDSLYYHYDYNIPRILINAFRTVSENKIKVDHQFKYPQNIGLTAMVYGDGFRKDGSYFYNRRINDKDAEYNKKYLFPFEDTTTRIDNGNARFEYGDKVSKKSTQQIIDFLDRCEERNIMIVAFLPPFAPYINQKLEENGNYGYMKKIYPELLPIFDRYGYELYDYTDSSSFSTDDMYIDGFHGDENTYHGILLDMKEQGSVLGKYIQ